jgi:hypothetical protein
VPPALEPRNGDPNSRPCPRPATLTHSADEFYPPFLKGTAAINKSGRRALTLLLHKHDRHVGSNIYCTAQVTEEEVRYATVDKHMEMVRIRNPGPRPWVENGRHAP